MIGQWPTPLPDREHIPDRRQHPLPAEPRRPLVEVILDIDPDDPHNQ